MNTAPDKVIASFDSASVLHAALVAALEGRPFSNLGNPEPLGRLVRVAARLPWPLLRGIYSRIGGAEESLRTGSARSTCPPSHRHSQAPTRGAAIRPQ
ncbi:hypothetical protein GCM10027613_32580 [Microlunatus endophyticus]